MDRRTARKIPGRLMAAALGGLLAITLASSLAAKDKKNKQPADAKKPGRIGFDIKKLVWPNPPAITRIRYVAMLTGEKIDAAAIQESVKPTKKSWMDRLAGTQPLAEKNIKLPFQFIRVYGVAVDSTGKIYAADQGVDAVFIMDPETKETQLIRNGHEARFGLINGLAMDDNDRLFVSDSRLHKILVFNAKHEQEASFGADVLADPGGIALDRENRFLYVTDAQKDQVIVFDADSFKMLRSIGTSGKKHTLTDPGNFSLPTNVAVDEDGDVYVSDTLNNRVEIFDAEGNFISEFGKAGDGPGYFARPKGIAVDCDKHIWVVDEVQSRVQVFNREGQLLIYVGEPGAYPGQFQAAYGIVIDKQNRVIVSEQFPGRVQVFRYVTDTEAEEARKKESSGEKQTPAAPAKKDSAPAKTESSAARSPR